MKMLLALATLALSFPATLLAADATAEIQGVHLCCKGCTSAIEKRVKQVPGAAVTLDQKAGLVTLSASDTATLQKAADAFVAAGFYGTPKNASITLNPAAGTKNKKVKSLAVQGVHLCCGECVAAVDRAAQSVPGIKNHTAEKGARQFTVTGNFNDRAFMEALHKQGLGGTIIKN